MCGIAGAIGDASPEAAERVEKMLDRLLHRGPDGAGLCVVEGAVFGHRRLAILDLTEAGAQPFRDAATRRAAVVNGQFHDHVVLRAEVEAGGATLRGRSDSELLLPLHARYGAAVVERLRGPYAFAIYDERSRTALLARDRLGKRPLHYVVRDGVLWFASEPGPLARALGLKPRREAVAAVLRLGYPAPPDAPFEDIRVLGPGERLTFTIGDAAPHIDRWWTPPAPSPAAPPTTDSAVDQLGRLLDEATRLRLSCDRPVGVLLSGGSDSAAVLSSAVAARGGPIPAFVGAFDDRAFDESSAAAETARALGAPLRVVRCDVGVADRLRKLVATGGDLIADSSILALAAVCEAARDDATVLLSGDGADEILLGYERHRVAAFGGFRLFAAAALGRVPFFRRNARVAKAAAAARAKTPRSRYAELSATTTSDALSDYLSPEILRDDPLAAAFAATPPIDDVLADVARLDLATYLPYDLMTKTDRAAMLFGVETWAPFLDAPLVDFALALPGALRADRRRGKLPLRELLRRRGLGFVAARRKRGFGVPLRSWLAEGPLSALAREALGDVREPFRGVLRAGSALPLLEALQAGRPIAPLVYACLVVALHHESFR